MNVVILHGRLTRDIDVTFGGANKDVAIGKTSIAVQRDVKNKDGKYDADFINILAFGKTAENMQKFFSKGSRIIVNGHIQTGSYTNKDGQKVYTTDVIVDKFDFVDSKSEQPSNNATVNMGFMNVADGVGDSGLPFN